MLQGYYILELNLIGEKNQDNEEFILYNELCEMIALVCITPLYLSCKTIILLHPIKMVVKKLSGTLLRRRVFQMIQEIELTLMSVTLLLQTTNVAILMHL